MAEWCVLEGAAGSYTFKLSWTVVNLICLQSKSKKAHSRISSKLSVRLVHAKYYSSMSTSHFQRKRRQWNPYLSGFLMDWALALHVVL